MPKGRVRQSVKSLILGGLVLFWSSMALAWTVEQIDVSSEGVPGNGGGSPGAVTSDGRFVVFSSLSDNLVPNDTNGWDDVFVRDRELGITERVNVADDGTQANQVSFIGFSRSISEDGRFVVFQSHGSNLVPGDTNNKADIFVYDRKERKIERVNVASDGSQGNGWSGSATITPDGRFAAFVSASSNLTPEANGVYQVFVRDRKLGTTTLVSKSSTGEVGNGQCTYVSISADGRKVAFGSWADNLVPGDTNGYIDAFVHDLDTGTTVRVSVASDGSQAYMRNERIYISPDGRFVTFDTDASNLVPDDNNGTNDVFLHDLETSQTERISLAPGGGELTDPSFGGSMGWDGRFVNFYAYNVSIRDRELGTTENLPVVGAYSEMSMFGKFVIYSVNWHTYLYIPSNCP